MVSTESIIETAGVAKEKFHDRRPGRQDDLPSLATNLTDEAAKLVADPKSTLDHMKEPEHHAGCGHHQRLEISEIWEMGNGM